MAGTNSPSASRVLRTKVASHNGGNKTQKTSAFLHLFCAMKCRRFPSPLLFLQQFFSCLRRESRFQRISFRPFPSFLLLPPSRYTLHLRAVCPAAMPDFWPKNLFVPPLPKWTEEAAGDTAPFPAFCRK